MNISTFELLCEASQLSFPDEEKAEFIQRMDSIIEFTSVVKNIDCDYKEDDSAAVSLSDLREDTITASLPAEKLLANTEPLFDCYVIPKIME
jgi:aspartyl/glutamyl-tRNA(Asn/Gln) amidotransferase C subunit